MFAALLRTCSMFWNCGLVCQLEDRDLVAWFRAVMISSNPMVAQILEVTVPSLEKWLLRASSWLLSLVLAESFAGPPQCTGTVGSCGTHHEGVS